MTDRHSEYIVVLEQDLRDDDAAAILTALKQVRGVAEVIPVVADPLGSIAQSRAEHTIKRKLLYAVFGEEPDHA